MSSLTLTLRLEGTCAYPPKEAAPYPITQEILTQSLLVESPVEVTSEFHLCPCFLSEEGRRELLLVACLLGQVLCLVAERAPDGKWIILGTSSRVTFGEETVLSKRPGFGDPNILVSPSSNRPGYSGGKYLHTQTHACTFLVLFVCVYFV